MSWSSQHMKVLYIMKWTKRKKTNYNWYSGLLMPYVLAIIITLHFQLWLMYIFLLLYCHQIIITLLCYIVIKLCTSSCCETCLPVYYDDLINWLIMLYVKGIHLSRVELHNVKLLSWMRVTSLKCKL